MIRFSIVTKFGFDFHVALVADPVERVGNAPLAFELTTANRIKDRGDSSLKVSRHINTKNGETLDRAMEGIQNKPT